MINDQLKELRLANGLSIYALAKKLNASRTHVTDVESLNKEVTLKLLKRYSEVLNVKIVVEIENGKETVTIS